MPKKKNGTTIRGIYRVNLYQNFAGELVLQARGPDGWDVRHKPATLDDANVFISSLMAAHPSQVKVTRWGDVAGATNSEQLQKETLSSL